MNDDLNLDGLVEPLSAPAPWSLDATASKVNGWYQQTFGERLPVHVYGLDAGHRAMGFKYHDALDVGLSPQSAKGKALASYLKSESIPFSSFNGPATNAAGQVVSTGTHFHIGPPGSRTRSGPSYQSPAVPQVPDDLNLAGLVEPPLRLDGLVESVTASGRGAAMARAQQSPVATSMRRTGAGRRLGGGSGETIGEGLTSTPTQAIGTGAPRRPNEIRPLTFTERVTNRVKEAINNYVPGVAALNTEEGIKTNAISGLVNSATLGAVDLPAYHSFTKAAPSKLAQTQPYDENLADTSGRIIGSLIPYIGAGKVIELVSNAPKIAKLINAARETGVIGRAAVRATQTGAQFGGVTAVRSAISIAKGKETASEGAKNTAVDALLGSTIGILAGDNPTLARHIMAFATPPTAMAVATGKSQSQVEITGNPIADTAIFNSILGLATYQGKSVTPEVPQIERPVGVMPEIPDVPVSTISEPRVIKGGRNAVEKGIEQQGRKSEYQGTQGVEVPAEAGGSNRPVQSGQVEQEALNLQGLVEPFSVSTPQPDLSTQAQPAIPDAANVTSQGAAGIDPDLGALQQPIVRELGKILHLPKGGISDFRPLATTPSQFKFDDLKPIDGEREPVQYQEGRKYIVERRFPTGRAVHEFNSQEQADAFVQKIQELKADQSGAASEVAPMPEQEQATLFHGTSKASAEAIRREGFQAGKSEGMNSEPISDFVFVTPKKSGADWYAKNNIRIKGGEVVSGDFKGGVYRAEKPTTEYGAMAELAEKLGQKLTGERIVDTKDLAERMRRNGYSAIVFKDRTSNREAWAVLPESLKSKEAQPAPPAPPVPEGKPLNLEGLIEPAESPGKPTGVASAALTPEVPQATALRASVGGVGEFIKQDIAPLVNWVPKAIDAFKRVAAPASRGPIAQQAAETVRDYAGRAARENDIAFSALKDARNVFSKLPDTSNLAFMDRMENGQPQNTPQESQVAASMRRLLNQDRDAVQTLKPELLQTFYENYFPHIWKDPAKAEGVFGSFFGKRPFEGSKAFLKQRTMPTIADGIAAGLEPVSANPVDLVLLKHAEIQRFLVAHRTLAEFKGNGLAQFVKLGDKAPDGWTKVNDKISDVYFPGEQGLVKSGSYYMPDEAAQVLNNYLSPGLAGNAIFDGWRQSNMLMTQAMLGLSAFHGTVTSLNSVMSKIALASMHIAEGRGAEAAKALAQAPTAPITDFFYGKKLQQEWSNPGSHPELAPLVDMMQKGGIRSKMEQVYMTNISRSMHDAFNQGNLPGAAIRAPFALFEQTAKPIMQYLVPRLKMAAAADLMKAELERLGPDATVEQQRSAAAQAVDSVDNRFGMLTYDNLFMNKMVKDGMLSSFLSFGWNLGTFRELGGGALDIAKVPYRLAKGQQAFTPRIGYTAVALPMVTALMGSTLNYLMTGKPPQEVKDAFFPRTGRMDRYGNPIRLTLPTYAKDAYAFYKRPVTTIQHKLSPGLNTTIELLQNRDYYGNPIVLSNKPIDTKLRELGSYLADKLTPISLRTQTKAKISYGRELQFFGIAPAASYINQRKPPKPTKTIEVPFTKKMERKFK